MVFLDGCLSVASLYFAVDDEEEEEGGRRRIGEMGRNGMYHSV
jgi:hypothetical protein